MIYVDYDNTTTILNKKRIEAFLSGDSKALVKNVHLTTKYLPDSFVFLTSYSTEKEKKEKEESIRKHFSNGIIWVPAGVSKATFAKPGAILIDDYNKNCDEWIAAGGVAFKYINKMNSITDRMPCVYFMDTSDHFYIMDILTGYPILSYEK